MAIACLLLFHSFFYLWYLAYLLELWCLDSMLSGIMLPRFHDSSFIYDVWHSTFWNYVASIPCSLFQLRYLNSGIMLPRFHDSSFIYDICFLHLELCCLDSMFLLSFTVFKILHSPFWNYAASILCSFFFHGMCILELCSLDSIITDYLRTVFGIQRIYYTVVVLPRFHRVRTRRPWNSLWARLKREKLEPISRIIWKKSPLKWV